MLEILKSNLFLPLYAITWIFSIIRLPKYFESTLKYFPIIIGYTLFTEILGALIYNIEDFTFFSEDKYSSYTLLIYNLYDLIFFPFFYHVYWKSISSNKVKKVIKYGGILFMLAIIINSFIANPLKYELWYAYVVGALLLIFSTLAYLNCVRWKSTFSGLSTNLLVWVSIGLLIFHLGYLPITIFKNVHLELTTQDYANVRKIHVGLIFIMYSCFLIGFMRMRRFKPMETI